MRELTIQVSDDQFDVLLRFLKTLPYVQLPKNLKYESETSGQIASESTIVYQRLPPRFEDFEGIDNTPFDLDDFTKNHSIQWQHLPELRELFKDAPFDEMIEALANDK